MRESTTESSPMTSHNEMLDETAIFNNSTADLMFSRMGRKHRNHTPSIICVIVVYCFTLGFRCQSVVASSQYYFSGASSSYYAESNTTTSYFILPKKCIHIQNKDVIVYDIFDNGDSECSDGSEGFYTDVPTYVAAMNKHDKNTYVADSYLDCIEKKVRGKPYYVRLGCSTTSTQALAVNLYEDSSCSTLSTLGSITELDVSDLEIPFKRCTSCAYWDSEYRDGSYYSEFCAILVQSGEECNNRCTKVSSVSVLNDGWTDSDKFLLGFLSIFGAALFVGIVLERQKMSKKEALLEEAAMTVAGLQKVHVCGIIVLFLLVVLIFALLQMKTLTWGLLLLSNIILFMYLIKLTAMTNGTDRSADKKDDESSNQSDGYSPFRRRNTDLT